MIEATHELAIRRATEADLALLLEWRKAMMRDMGHEDDAQMAAALPCFAAWLREHMAQPARCAAFIGEATGTPAACAIAFIYDWYPGLGDASTRRGYILNVYTAPEWRRHGFAAQLTTACVTWLRAQGIRTVLLHASAQGQPVYARQGFVASGLQEMVLRIE
jgi:ribosomal protein S18 acetylase RimI-like enzyme